MMRKPITILITFVLCIYCHTASGQEAGDVVLPADTLAFTLPDSLDYDLRILNKIDSASTSVNASIQSLATAGYSGDMYTRGLDSLYTRHTAFLSTIQTDSLSVGAKTKLRAAQETVKRKTSFLDSLRAAGTVHDPDFFTEFESKLQIPEIDTALPDGLTIPATDNIASAVPDNIVPDDIDALNSLAEDIGKLPEDISITSPSLSSEAIENELASIDQVNAFKTVSEKATIENITPPEAGMAMKLGAQPEDAKEVVTRRAMKVITNQLDGKETLIQQTVTDVLDKKPEIPSIDEVRGVKVKRVNPEKDKPFIERAIFGTNFHVKQYIPEWTGVTWSPYVGYKFSDRFRTSIGVSHHFELNVKPVETRSVRAPFSMRVNAGYMIVGNTFFFAEYEYFNKSGYALTLRTGAKDIPFSVGLFRSFHISKSLKWNALYLLPVEEIKDFTFNSSVFRFGIEYMVFARKKEEEVK